MSFRRPKQTNVGSSHWRLEHRAKLLHWLPAQVVGSNVTSSMCCFTERTTPTPAGLRPGWRPRTRPRFCDSSKREITEPAGFQILDELRRLLAHR